MITLYFSKADIWRNSHSWICISPRCLVLWFVWVQLLFHSHSFISVDASGCWTHNLRVQTVACDLLCYLFNKQLCMKNKLQSVFILCAVYLYCVLCIYTVYCVSILCTVYLYCVLCIYTVYCVSILCTVYLYCALCLLGGTGTISTRAVCLYID